MFKGKIFGIGLGRTGSVSLSLALEELGIKTVHYPGQFTQSELLNGKFGLSVLSNHQALVDGIEPFFPQLDKRYPDSRFILTIREVESWVRSRLKFREYLRVLRPKMSPLHREFHANLEKSLYGEIDPGEVQLRVGCKRYNAEVIEYFKARSEELLVMDIPGGDGWEKLCPFLCTDLPASPFPHANSSEDIGELTWRLNAIWEDLHDAIPIGTKFLLVDDAKLGMHFNRHDALPFPNRDGVWWGAPTDSKTAIDELKVSMKAGAQFIAFAWPSFWWFDYYKEFTRYINNKSVVIKNNRCVLFDLRGD